MGRAVLFDRPTTLEGGTDGLRNWLSMFGDEFFAAVPDAEREAILTAVESRLREALYEGSDWTADYRRLRVLAIRD